MEPLPNRLLFFNYCGISTELIDYIVDTTWAKQGKLSPGMHIPVISPQDGFNESVDYAFLGAWNFENEICAKEEEFLESGRFITHVPYVRLLKEKKIWLRTCPYSTMKTIEHNVY